MSNIKRVGDLETDQDLGHERLEWKIERFGWVAIGVTITAALLGFLGPGPMSRHIAQGSDHDFWVEYNRFERHQAPSVLRIHSKRSRTNEENLKIWLSRDFVEGVELNHIDPKPETVAATHDRFIYTFHLADNEATAVTFHYEPNAFLRKSFSIGVVGGAWINISQFIFP